jgi:hypothetical protein
MMKLTIVIKRLRKMCPSFQNRVSGTSAFVKATDVGAAANLAVPYCFVIPMEEKDITPATEEHIGTRTQRIWESFATVICVDNSVNTANPVAGLMKLTAMDQIAAIEDEIAKAFDDWVFDSKYDVIRFYRGRHVEMDGKRMWHQFEWAVEYDRVPSADPAIQAQIENIVRNVTDDGASYEVPDPSKIEHIHMSWRHGERDEIEIPQVDRVIPRFPLESQPPDPDSTEIEEKQAGADWNLAAPFPPTFADPDSIGDAAIDDDGDIV